MSKKILSELLNQIKINPAIYAVFILGLTISITSDFKLFVVLGSVLAGTVSVEVLASIRKAIKNARTKSGKKDSTL